MSILIHSKDKNIAYYNFNIDKINKLETELSDVKEVCMKMSVVITMSFYFGMRYIWYKQRYKRLGKYLGRLNLKYI